MAVANLEIAESWASPPELEEVSRELDPDTKHIGRPTRSPRRKEWTPDPYHCPSDARRWITPREMNALIEVCANVDPHRTARIPVKVVREVLAAVDSESMTGKAERVLPRKKAASRFGDGEETVSFASLVGFIAECNRIVREPFGGKRCLVNRIPLPPCCKSNYCGACLQKPSASALKGASDDDLQKAALKIVFLQHDADGSGELEMDELPKILDDHGVEYDERRVQDLIEIYDIDRSGALDFEEFSALLKDMDADKIVASKRMELYHLPLSLLKEFSKEAIEEMRMTFGIFDESGDGRLDEEELEKLLRTFGQEPTKENIHEEMVRIDYDRSGTVEFHEFVLLMKKIRDGEVDLDDSAFGQAVMNSTTASRLSQELRVLESNPIPCVESAKLLKPSPAILQAKIAGPDGTPYEGRIFTLELVVPDGYPFIAPASRFLERVFHLNLTILLDGSTALRSILDQWTAAWDVARLLREVVQLLRVPDPCLLPDDLRRGSSAAVADTEPTEDASPATRSVSNDDTFHRGSSPEKVPRALVEHDDFRAADDDNGCCEQAGPSTPPKQDGRCLAAVVMPKADDSGGERIAGGDVEEAAVGVGCSSRRRTTGVRGEDLRESKRSALVTARVAALWYDNKPLYDQTARRIAQGQALARP